LMSLELVALVTSTFQLYKSLVYWLPIRTVSNFRIFVVSKCLFIT
jgi:hypothetical protein